MVETATSKLFEYGVLGILFVLLGLYTWIKDREAKKEREDLQKQWLEEKRELQRQRDDLQRQLNEEKDARIKDAQDYAQMSLALQSRVLDATHKMGDIVESWESRTAEVLLRRSVSDEDVATQDITPRRGRR